MKQYSKILISLIAILCVLSLMVTGVYSAVTTNFTITHKVSYTYQEPEITIFAYKVDPTKEPTTTDSRGFYTCVDGKVGTNIPDKGSSPNTKYKFLGWYTYDFATKRYGDTPYNVGDTINSSDLDDKNALHLFEKYGYIVTVNNNGTGNTSIPDYGITINVSQNNGDSIGTVSDVNGSATNVVIPNFVCDSNGNQIPITSIEKPKNNKWGNVTSITFVEPSNITNISEVAMEDLEKIESIILPSSLQTIEKSALKSLKNLQWIVIPKSLISLGDDAFCDVPNSCKVYCEMTEASKPTGWGKGGLSECTNIYWANEWYYNNGLPIAN